MTDAPSWPTASTTGDPRYSLASAQEFFDASICKYNAAGQAYIVHSALDEPSGVSTAPWGDSYGVWTADRQSKGLRLPICPSR